MSHNKTTYLNIIITNIKSKLMKKITLSIVLLAFLFNTTNAQKIVDKVFKATDKVTISTVSNYLK